MIDRVIYTVTDWLMAPVIWVATLLGGDLSVVDGDDTDDNGTCCRGGVGFGSHAPECRG